METTSIYESQFTKPALQINETVVWLLFNTDL